MRHKLIALAVAALIGITAVSTPSKVEAHSNGWWIPGAVIGGIALGAIVSGAYRPYYGYRSYYYAPGPYYYYAPRPYYYYAPRPYYYGRYYYRPYRYYRRPVRYYRRHYYYRHRYYR